MNCMNLVPAAGLLKTGYETGTFATLGLVGPEASCQLPGDVTSHRGREDPPCFVSDESLHR